MDRTTCVGIGAHQDDLEIMAWPGALHCFRSDPDWFLGVTVTDGAGSPRSGIYSGTTNEEMIEIRRVEQRKAADIGEYSAVIQLSHTSSAVKDAHNNAVVGEIAEILERSRPSAVYTHNLADKHDTHVAVALKTIRALRQMAPETRPSKVYGCEVWRGLDWLLDTDKIAFDVSANQNVASAVLGIYDSQISGGKRYDLATLSRWRANATYHASHDTDKSEALVFAMDLSPLVRNRDLDIAGYVREFIERFAEDVCARIAKHA